MSDDAKALPHVATALIDKRRELAGKIEDPQRQLKIAVADLDHLETSLRLFVPDIDLTEHGPRPVPPRHAAFKGEVTRVVLDSLRTAGRPLSTKDLAARVVPRLAFTTTSPGRTLPRMLPKWIGAKIIAALATANSTSRLPPPLSATPFRGSGRVTASGGQSKASLSIKLAT